MRKLLRRYSRSRGTAGKKKEPLLIERLPAILLAMPDDLPTLRDRALLLLGYAGAFRRSELVAIDVAHPRLKVGLYVWIGAAKNDPRKKGASFTFRGWREASCALSRHSGGGLRR